MEKIAHLKLMSKVLTQFIENVVDEEDMTVEEKEEIQLAEIELENVNAELEDLLFKNHGL
jgi:hypothetical protein